MTLFAFLGVKNREGIFYDPINDENIKFPKREKQVINEWKRERKKGISLQYNVKQFS